MKLTRTGIGLLTRQYRSVLRKCFLINVGLYALLAPAASLTTATAVAVTAMPNVAQADYPVHNVPAGTTVDKFDDAFTNNTITNVAGAYVNNSGTINYIDAVVRGNTLTQTSAVHSHSANSLIVNYGKISNIVGSIIKNISYVENGGDYGDNGQVILLDTANSVIDTIDLNMIGNSTAVTGGGNSSGGLIAVLASSAINNLYGIYVDNIFSDSVGGDTAGAVLQLWSNAKIKNIDATFIGNNVKGTSSSEGTVRGGVIANIENSNITSLNGTFIGNYAQANSGAAYGGAVYTDSTSTIDSIGAANDKALFIGNYAQSTTGAAYGGAIYNAGTISGDINADFIGNSVGTKNNASPINFGGAIFFADNASVGKVNGDFINNRVDTKSIAVGGAVAANENVNISFDGKYINNYAKSTENYSEGGALYFASHTKVPNIAGDFINNQTITTSSDSSRSAYGGAIATFAAASVNGGIGKIQGNFINNAASANAGNAYGGAIINNGGGTITDITADFINNSATSTKNGEAQGGAIDNTGTIGNVTGEFKGNTATSTSGTAKGGAIYNGTDKVINITDSYFNSNNASAANDSIARGGAIFNDGILTVKDSSFRNNSTSLSAHSGGAISGDNGSISISAENKDVLFYNNKSGSLYMDIAFGGPDNTGDAVLNLNANSGKSIVFGGIVAEGPGGATTLSNINNASNGATGGNYVFNNKYESNIVHLYNNANVRFGNVRQDNGTVTYGSLYAGATTVDENGAYLNFANNNTAGVQRLGNLTLGNDLKIGIDTRLAAENSIDGLSSGTVTSNGHKILIDYINAWYPDDEETTGTSYVKANWVSPSTLVSIIDISPTLHINSAYEWDGYTASYAAATGDLTLKKVDTGTENLAGFLHNNTTDTSYDMVRDEQMLVDLNDMAGENNSKTINANGYNIIGNQHAGVTLADGQTLTLNDANVEGFYGENGSAIRANPNSKVNINNSVFRNNTETNSGILYSAYSNLNIDDSSFYNNVSFGNNYETAVIHKSGGIVNINAKTKDSIFEGNSGMEGSVIRLTNSATANITGENGHKVIFSNNTASDNGGVITLTPNNFLNASNAEFLYNSAVAGGAINIQNLSSRANISDALFKGNEAKSSGGAITNSGTLSVENSTFENNTATSQGGAIYNAGTMSVENSTFKGNMADGYGAAIYNANTLSIENSVFKENTSVNSNSTAIHNTDGATITKITGSIFDGNISLGADGHGANAAIYNRGSIEEISDTIFKNNIGASAGGALGNNPSGTLPATIGTLSADFIDNQLIAGTNSGGGGAIWNVTGEIGALKGNYIGNSIIGSGGVYGGAIENAFSSKINSVAGSFIDNYIINTESANRAWGGGFTARNNTIIGTMGSPSEEVLFKNNYAMNTGSGEANGGAIFVDGTSSITSIGTSDNHAKFEGNYAQANTGNAYGGAIYNSGTIDNIYADFTNNHVSSATNQVDGGAIYNAGTIKNITGIFKDNYSINAKGSVTYGGAIANVNGNVKITDSYFSGNYAPYHDGGAVYNRSDGGNTRMIITNSVFDANSSKYGAGVYVHNNTVTSVSDSIIKNNNATSWGGGAMSCSSNANLNLKDITFAGNSGVYGGALYVTQGGKMTVIDSYIIDNTATNAGAGLAMSEDGSYADLINLIADSKDVVFKNNKVGNDYNDVHLASTADVVNLNAAQNKSIDFGGSVTGSGTMNINKSGLSYTDVKDNGTFETETKNITQAGGDYIFRNEVSGQTMNLYNGANVQLRNLRQSDGTTSFGNLSLTGFTSTGAGNILDAGNARIDTSGQLALGTTTLNANTNLRLDVNLANATASAGDLLSGTWSSGSGNFVIDSINILNTGATTQALINNDTLKSHIAMASTYHTFEQDYKDRYTVTYSNGYLNFNQNKTGTLNLVGYLSNASSTATTPYDMTFDEPVLRNIGDMTGTTKTVNAGNYTINGNGFSGVTVGANQTLNINGGVWDGFYTGTSGAVIAAGDNSKISLNNVVMQNNNVGVHGVIVTSGDVESVTGIFKNNTGGGSAGLTGWNATNANFKSIRAEFSNNTTSGAGTAISVGEQNKVNIYGGSSFNYNSAGNKGGAILDSGASVKIDADNNDIIFSNNTAVTHGGAILVENEGTLDISATGGDVIFSNNTAGKAGGAITNQDGTLTISATGGDVIFDNNTASGQNQDGGAIYLRRATSTSTTTSKTTLSATNGHNIIFKNNQSINDAEGGAISVIFGAELTIGDGVIFSGNSSAGDKIESWGGAIYANSDSSKINSIGSAISRTIFENNYASNPTNGLGGAILTKATVGDVYATFTGNYAESTGKNAFGGAFGNYQGKVGNISADFTGNYAKSTGEYAAGAGGMVISGDTTDNAGSGRAYGGAIFNLAQVTKDDSGNITGVVENTGVIDSISGNFKDNYVYSENGYALGGAIYNEYGTIGSISGGDSFQVTLADGTTTTMSGFYRNKAEGSVGKATQGAAIFNTGSINTIISDFVENAVNQTGVEEAGSLYHLDADGSAIKNFGSIGDITGDFKHNSTVTQGGSAYGGAIFNEGVKDLFSPTIQSIVGNFISNSVEGKHTAMGGAIISAHSGEIGTLKGSYSDNTAISTEGNAYGGAVVNYDKAIITSIEDSLFTDNKAISNNKQALGGAIYNNTSLIGTLDGTTLLANDKGIVDSSFSGNYVSGDSTSTGGAIWNSGNINLSALQSDVNFWNNKANDRYNDIYNSGTMNFNADQNKTMSFGGSIEGSGAININTGATNGGTYVFKSGVSAGNVVVGSADSGYAPASLSFEKAEQEDGSITNGTFDVASLTINGDGNSLSTRNDKVDTNSATTLTLNNALNMQIDGDLQSHTGDSIAVSNLTAAAPKSLRLTAMNFTTDPDVTTLSKTDTVDVNITGENDILAQNNAYTLASTNPDDTTEEQIEQAYLDNLTSSSRNYNKTYAFRSAKLITSGNNQTYVQYGDAITLKWLYENYINGWSGGNYILNNVTDGGSAVPGETLTVGGALMALDSALGKNTTYDFSTQSVADVLVNNYYTKLMKKDEKFDTNEGIMDVKSLKKDTNSSQGRIIKGVSAFPSNLCAYPFDMPHTANDNNKNVIVRSAKHDVTIFGRQSDNTATTTQQAA